MGQSSRGAYSWKIGEWVTWCSHGSNGKSRKWGVVLQRLRAGEDVWEATKNLLEAAKRNGLPLDGLSIRAAKARATSTKVKRETRCYDSFFILTFRGKTTKSCPRLMLPRPRQLKPSRCSLPINWRAYLVGARSGATHKFLQSHLVPGTKHKRLRHHKWLKRVRNPRPLPPVSGISTDAVSQIASQVWDGVTHG